MNILYHAGCDDGFGAAYVCWKYFKDANFIPVSYPATLTDEQIEKFRDQDVIVVDFCFDIETTHKLYDVVNALVVLDHHSDPAYFNMVQFILQRFGDNVSNSANSIYYAKDKFRIVFDPTLSGVMIAWNYWFPKLSPPKALQHIMEADLWKFQPETKRFKSYLQSFEQDFNVWDSIIREYEYNPDRILEQGEAILRRYNADIKYIWKHQIPAVLTLTDENGVEHRALALNTTKKYASSIATNLCNIVDPITGYNYKYGCSYLFSGDKAIVSLRCYDDFRVNTLAAQYGGGGHEKASGFVMNATEFMKLLSKS